MSGLNGSQSADGFIRAIELKAAMSCFLLGAKSNNLMFNGRTATEAYEAFCEFFGYDPVELEARLTQRETAQPSQGTVWEQAHRDFK